MLVGRINSLTQGTSIKGKPLIGMPYGEFQYWDTDAFAQDSWKLKPNFTLEYGVRFGKWTNNKELNGEGGYFDPALYNPSAGSFLDPGTYKLLNGVCYVYNDCGPDGVLPNRSAFALPRINAAWDIDGEGKNVVRGGYGLFYNRSMGNVEYDNSLRLPPNAYHVGVGDGDVNSNGVGPDLRQRSPRQLRRSPRQHRHQHADAGFVQVADDAQLQRVVCPPDSVESGGRSRLRRHARPRPREPHQRQRHAVWRAGDAAPTTVSICRCRPIAWQWRASATISANVPAIQRARGHHALRLPRQERLRLDAAHTQPADRQAAAVLRRLHAAARPTARSAVSTRTSTRTIRRAPTAVWAPTAGTS